MLSLQHSLFALYQATLILPAFSAEIEAPGRFANLQAALDAAKAGDVVVIEPGRYDEQLTIPAGVTLQSSGDNKKGKTGLARAEAVVIDSQGKAPAVTLLEGAALDGVTVTGAGAFNQKEFDRHHAERGENLADHHGAVGAEGSNSAIAVNGVTATVRHCLVHDNGFPGIGVIGPGRAVVSNNHVFRNMGGGIGIANGSRAQVSENRCWMNLRAGIGCRNSSPSIFKNHCFENVRAGIGIREGATPDVSENHCYQNRRAGIGVRMAGTEPRIFKNQCYQNGMAGIGCRDEAAPVIFENECYRNKLAGIGAMSNARPTIVGNKLYENEAAAIGLAACESGEAYIFKNSISPLKLVGIGIQSGWTVRVKDNHIQREGGLPPLVMVFKGASGDFTGNTFTGSGVAGIRCQGRIFVADNQFDCPAPRKGGPPQFAVWPLEGSHVAMTDDNRINRWRQPEIPAIRVSNRKELEAALRNPKPGSTILLAGGTYEGGLTLAKLQGTEDKPITLAAADLGNRPVFKGGNSGLHLVKPRHASLRYLTISEPNANGLNIDDGGDIDSPAHHLTLDGLTVRDIRGRGNRDGIKLSGVQNFTIQDCLIERWGTGGSGIDMVGCHQGVISGCHFEHQKDALGANGVQAKGGSSKITIRRCQFKNAGGRAVNLGGSTGAPYFRPKNAPSEASHLEVHDCLFIGSLAPVAFVGVDGAIVRHNTIFNPGRWIARILQENTAAHLTRCRNGRFEHNLVAFHSRTLATAVNIGPSTQPETFQFAGNEWLCLDGLPAANKLLPFPGRESEGHFHESIVEPAPDENTIQHFKAEPGIGVRHLPIGLMKNPAPAKEPDGN